MTIDFSDPKAKISRYFTVKEACWAPQWNRLQNENDGLDADAKAALVDFFCNKMDIVRELLGYPIKVHVSFRSKAYNSLVGGAANSCHMARKEGGVYVAACDFSVDYGLGAGANCDKIKAELLPVLEKLGLRMEDNGAGATWVHLDNRKPGPSGRYFPI